MHPREGWNADGTPPRGRFAALAGDVPPSRPALSRRGFLTRAAGTGLAASSLGSLLAACGSSGTGAAQQSQIPLPRPTSPVSWPIFAANKPIKNGLLPERNATLKIFNWVAYVNQKCVNDFAKKYNCKVEVTTFNTMTEALGKLASGQVNFDVFMGVTVDVLGKVIEQQIIQPLNHTYLPNISQAWPQFTNPFYDQHWQYTAPYTIYTTGIAWRKDHVSEDPYTAANGWAFPWQPKYKGKVAILDDYREAISLGLMKTGSTDLNATDPRLILTAQQALQDLARQTNMHINNNDYTEVPSGQIWIHHAWSGDMAAAAQYMPKGVPVDVVGYWFPPNGVGPIANDTSTVLHGAQNPVLAHLFVNYLLDEQHALTNIGYNGYMQPVNGITPQKLVHMGILPASLISTAVLPTYFDRGLKELQLPLPADQLWEQAWQTVSQGV